MLNQKILLKEAGFTLIEIIAVLVILGVLASVGVPRYVDLEANAKQKAINTVISEINAREKLTWADHKISTSGFVSDEKIFSGINYDIDSNFEWNAGDPKITGGTIIFKGESFTLSRLSSTYLKPANWKQ
jgi:prepilin-type N-terminal cleavage/methylation domain-containing protein